MNISEERRREREREDLRAYGWCVFIGLLCIALAALQPAACKVVDGSIPALCAE